MGQVEPELLVDQAGVVVDVLGREAQQDRAQALDLVLAAQVGDEGLGVGVDRRPVDLHEDLVAADIPDEVHAVGRPAVTSDRVLPVVGLRKAGLAGHLEQAGLQVALAGLDHCAVTCRPYSAYGSTFLHISKSPS